jgi:sterol desaturase/sphingolipid hydroxylase (fatty acid hydroxylase superfamily)
VHNERVRKSGLDALLTGALVGFGAALLALEVLRPLRQPPREPKLRRMQRNAAFGGIAAATVQALEQPIVLPLAQLVERRRWGLSQRLPLPGPLRTAAGLIALDYTLFLWHVLVHRAPQLWRFHRVHHADLDLDASTAIRFHFGELIASVPWRAAQILVLGIDTRTLTRWQTLTLASVLFHHSNVRLHPSFERLLGYVIVTPRLHGIHHSREADQMDANWSSGLSLWDRLHGTLRTDVPQDEIDIGVNGVSGDELTLPRMLAAPFTTNADRATPR